MNLALHACAYLAIAAAIVISVIAAMVSFKMILDKFKRSRK
jgi:hypothetical protein